MIPSEQCVSSRDLGWTSLLVEVHTGIAWNKAYTGVTTLDPRVSVTLDQLATEAGISKFHFARLFREKIGQTPFKFLAETRLSAGRKLLVTTDRRVGEIALACGFGAASHFTAAFTARHGISPAQYRAMHED